MERKELVGYLRQIADRFRVTSGRGFKLEDHDPADTAGLTRESKAEAREALKEGVKILAEMQAMLWAHDHWALLLVLQALDASGKDGVIKHVMSGINPQGCEIHSFKAPVGEELEHDFLWRCQRRLPSRGAIGIFNRSYYEETLVVRVHPELLEKQRIPARLLGDDLWQTRFRDICAFEQHLAANGTITRKCFLHLSKDEQRKRFLERIDDPAKNWKFSEADVTERGYFDDYMTFYQDTISATATKQAPWFVIPADKKWFTRLVVAGVVVDALASLDLEYPELDQAGLQRLAEARARLIGEG